MSALDKAFLFGLLAIAVSVPAFALTASPAMHEFTVHDGIETYTVTIRNDETKPLTVTLTPDGPFAQEITVPPSFSLSPGEQHTVTVSIGKPREDTPGVLEGSLLIESRSLQENTVSAASAVAHVIRMRTPVEGTYLHAQLLQSVASLGKPLTITLALENIGTKPIARANATVRVSGPLNAEYSTPGIVLEPGEVGDLLVTITPTIAGEYKFTAYISYDGKESVLTSSAMVGEYTVTVGNISVSGFRLGEPFRVSTKVTNAWITALPISVHTAVQQNSTEVSGQSTSILLQPQEQRDIAVFIESRGLVVGPATVQTTVNFGSFTTQQSVPAVIGVDELILNPSPPTVSWLAVVVLLACIAVLVVLSVLWRRRKP